MVRAIWDDEASKWWFTVLDIVGAFNQQGDYEKNRNYWKYLKAKLKKEHGELVSDTTQLKLLAADGIGDNGRRERGDNIALLNEQYIVTIVAISI